MSISPIIDERYRLRPADLGWQAVQVTIQNVSWQGIEQLRPLLHLREFPQKRLLLDSQQVQALIGIVGSSLAHDWIGHTIFLTAERVDGELSIRLHALTEEPAPGLLRAPHRPIPKSRQTLLLIALLVLLFGLVFFLEQVASLTSLLQP